MKLILGKLIMVAAAFFVVVTSGCATYRGDMMGDKDDSERSSGGSGCH